MGGDDPVDWNRYWLRAGGSQRGGLYEAIAELYRSQIISRAAAAILSRHLIDSDSRHYLHAGCGSGGSVVPGPGSIASTFRRPPWS